MDLKKLTIEGWFKDGRPESDYIMPTPDEYVYLHDLVDHNDRVRITVEWLPPVEIPRKEPSDA